MDARRPPPAPGVAVADLGRAPRRLRTRGADLVLVVLAGSVEVAVGRAAARLHTAGAVAVCPRGVPWSARPGADGARLVLVAFPGGPEEAVAALLHDSTLDDAALVALAADGGVELLLVPVPG